jgi:eukaryotic-like serine/threonine-protein kinase
VESGQAFEPVQFGRYLLVERLAVGGMAEIFRAKIRGAHGFEKTLVVKRILPHLASGEQFIKMFIDEARVMQQLNHPKVVQVLDFGEEEGQYYIVMEYVEGLDALGLLRRCAQKRCRPTTGITVHILAEVLDALDYAHNLTDPESGQPLGIVHRDISPSNIFLSGLGEVKLGDFGIARGAFRESQTEAGTLKGKYGYMAPEQVDGRQIDRRADVFSVGIVLAELLMIRRLFMAKSDLEILLQVRDARLDRLDRYGRHIPKDLRRIVESALARDPEMRYQDAAAFRDALHRYLFDNRRMVRSTDVRRFLMRLTDLERPAPSKLPAPPIKALDPVKDTSTDETDPEDTTAVVRAPSRKRKRSATEYAQHSRGKESQHRLASSSVPRISEESTPTAPQGALPFAASGTPAGFSEGERTKPVPEVLGEGAMPRKRRIRLRPPPEPAPIPTGLPQTGESPRIRTQDALAAVPELSVNEASASSEFFDSMPRIEALSDHDEMEGTGPADQLKPAHALSKTHTTSGEFTSRDEPSARGELSSRSLFALLFELALAEETGLLVIKQDEAVKEIFLVDGDPHFVASNQADELFGQYLTGKGVISNGELSMALAVLPHFDGRLGDALVSLKLLRPMEVLRHLTQQVRQKIIDTFAWREGEFNFYRGRQAVNESAPLGLDAFELMARAALALPEDVLTERAAPLMEAKPIAVRPPPLPPEVFRLGDDPRDIFELLEGEVTLAKMVGQYDEPANRDRVIRLIYLFAETGLIRT